MMMEEKLKECVCVGGGGGGVEITEKKREKQKNPSRGLRTDPSVMNVSSEVH